MASFRRTSGACLGVSEPYCFALAAISLRICASKAFEVCCHHPGLLTHCLPLVQGFEPAVNISVRPQEHTFGLGLKLVTFTGNQRQAKPLQSPLVWAAR